MFLAKKQYMALGPRFYFPNKMAITRRIMNEIEIRDWIPEAEVISHLLTVSNRDLKHCLTF